MNEQTIWETILEDCARAGQEAEVYELETEALPVSFKAGELESAKLVQTSGRGLRLIENGRLGFASSGDWDDRSIILESARESAALGGTAYFHFPGPQEPTPVQCFDPQVEALGVQPMIDLGKELVSRLLAYNAHLEVNISLGRSVQKIHLVNTQGLDLSYRRTSFSLGVEVVRAVEGDILTVYDSASSCRLDGVDGPALVARLLQRLRWSEKIAAAPSKALPLVVSPQGSMLLLYPLFIGLSGRAAFLHTSPLEGKEEQPVLDPRITLNDDPCRDFASRSAPFDDEGVPTDPKPLIEDGVLRGFLYDLKTAGQAGKKTTGNGFRHGHTSTPGIEAGNWLLKAGPAPLSSLLRDLPEALLVENVIGLGEGNVEQGEFSNNVSLGFLLHHGEVIGRIKNTMIAGNIYALLRDRLIALDDQAEWVYGSLQVPAILVDGVNATSQG